MWVGVGSRDESPVAGRRLPLLEHVLFKGTRRSRDGHLVGGRPARRRDQRVHRQEFTCYYAHARRRPAGRGGCRLGPGALVDHHRTRLRVRARRDSSKRSRCTTTIPATSCTRRLPHRLRSHPAGRPILGTADSINALTRDSVRRYYRKWYRPEHIVVSAAGNLDHATVVRLVRRAFSQAGDDLGRLRRRFGRAPARVFLGAGCRAAAPHRAGQPGAWHAGGQPDRRPTLRARCPQRALGGGMSSRLFQEVREKRGLAYSVYSYTPSTPTLGCSP